jgi:hypothetical protein
MTVAGWADRIKNPGQGGMHTEPSMSLRVLPETSIILLRFGLHLSVFFMQELGSLQGS